MRCLKPLPTFLPSLCEELIGTDLKKVKFKTSKQRASTFCPWISNKTN